MMANSRRSSRRKATPIWQGKRRGLLAGLVLAGILQALAISGFSLVIAQLIEASAQKNTVLNADTFSFKTLVMPISMIIGAAIFIGILRWGEKVLSEHLGQDYVTQVRLKLFKHLLHCEWRTSQAYSHGSMMLRFVTDLNGLRRWVALGLGKLLVVSSTIIVTLIIFIGLQPILALLTFGSVLLGAIVCYSVGAMLGNKIRLVRKYRARLAATTNDRISSVGTVQLFSQEKRELRRVQRQSHQLYDAIAGRAHILGALQGVLEFTILFSAGSVLLVGLWLSSLDLLHLGEVIAGMALINLLLAPLRDLGRTVDYWQHWCISQEKIARFLTMPQRKQQQHNDAFLENGNGYLQANNISIEAILEPTTFSIRPDDYIVLQGPNGSGKSSLLLAIAGILPLNGGEISLDSVPVAHYSTFQTEGVSLLADDLGLMRGSLKRNLTYGNTKASEEELETVIKQCHLHTIIENLPKGLDSHLIEKGQNLSTGERQRILLARALLTRPRILLIDEIDANLDSASRIIIERTLNNFTGAIVQVSHHTPFNLKKSTRYWQLDSQQLYTDIQKPKVVCA